MSIPIRQPEAVSLAIPKRIKDTRQLFVAFDWSNWTVSPWLEAMGTEGIRNRVELAVKMWTDQMPFKVNVHFTAWNPNLTDILISFGRLSYAMENTRGMTTVTNQDANGRVWCRIHVDTSKACRWGLQSAARMNAWKRFWLTLAHKTTQDFLSFMLHEMAHAILGAGHSGNPKSIVYEASSELEQAQRFDLEIRAIPQHDVECVQDLFASI